MSSLGKTILFYRSKFHLSRLNLALSASITPKTLYRIEHGKSTPKVGTIIRIEKALGLPENTLLPLCYPPDSEKAHITLQRAALFKGDELVLNLHIHLLDE